MYAEGPDEAGVQRWVEHVQGLRYKDYRCLRKVAPVTDEGKGESERVGFEEVGSVWEFKEVMVRKGLLGWWREAMGYDSQDKIISGSG